MGPGAAAREDRGAELVTSLEECAEWTDRRVKGPVVESDHDVFWPQAHEALAREPGVELADHDVFAPSLKDGLDRG